MSIVACPWCGSASVRIPVENEIAGGCIVCGRLVRQNGVALVWPAENSVRTPPRTLSSILRTQLNMLTNRLSPLRLLSDWRTENYYRRILHDDRLASRWVAHYLHGLDVPSGSWVLDHGCGRGRHSAILRCAGFRVHAQDIGSHRWWSKLSDCHFQVVPPETLRLPWSGQAFHLVLDVGVLHYVMPQQLDMLVREVYRVLAPGGYWLAVEANDESYGAFLPRQFCGRLHPLYKVRELAAEAGFQEIEVGYEGFYAPVAPRLVNFIRKQAWPAPFDISDYGSWLEQATPERRRGFWRLCLRKPPVSSS